MVCADKVTAGCYGKRLMIERSRVRIPVPYPKALFNIAEG